MSEQQTEQLLKILVVDDSRLMRFAVKKILGKAYSVIEAENGELAWTCICEQTDIQLVFSDINMPVLDGFGLLERMRNSEHNHIQNLPVVIITGKEDDEQTKIDVLEKGASDFITKPFDSLQLRARAKSYVRFNQTAEKLQDLSTLDELTGLGSLRYYHKTVDENIAQLQRDGGECIMVQLEIENFKQLFIRYGKKNADTIIESVGKIVLAQVRVNDRAARISLALFSIFLMSSDFNGATKLITRIREAIHNLVFSFNGDNNVNLTSCVAMYIPNIEKTNNYLTIADKTHNYLKTAIESGGNCIFTKYANPYLQAEHKNNNPIKQLTLIDTFSLLQQGDLDSIDQSKDELLSQLLPLLKHIINDEIMFEKLRKLLNY